MNLTILVVSDESKGVEQPLTDLSSRGMIDEFLITSADGSTVVLEEGKRRGVDLLGYIAGRQLELIRLIVLTFDGQPLPQTVIELANQIKANVSSPTVLDRYVLAVPQAGVNVDNSVFQKYWTYNLLVEPTDMAGEAGFAKVATNNYLIQQTIAASAVSLIGALWRWLESSPLDANALRARGGGVVDYDDSVFGPRLRIIRLVTRIVDAGNITMQAVARAMGPGIQLPPPAGCIRNNDPQKLLRTVVDEVFSEADVYGFKMRFSPPVPPPPPQQDRAHPLALLKLFFREVWNEIRNMPMEFLHERISSVKRRIERAVTNFTFGEDARIVAGFDPPEALTQLTSDRKSVSDLLSQTTIGDFSIAPCPSTWSGLTSITFALLDGDEARNVKGFKPPKADGRPTVVADSQLIAPLAASDSLANYFLFSAQDSALVEGLESGEMLQVFDSHGYQLIHNAVSELIAESEAEKGREAALSSAEGSNSPDSESSSGGETSEATEIRVDLNHAKDLISRLEAWKDGKQSTFLWSISERLAEQIERAARLFSQTESRLVASVAEIEKGRENERSKRTSFRKKSFRILLVILAVAALSTAAFLLISLLTIFAGIGLIFFGLSSTLIMIYRTARERARAQNQLSRAIETSEWLISAREHCAREVHRLGSVYIQYLDWAEIIASVALNPLGTLSVAQEEPWGSTSGALSLVSGTPVISESRARAITLNVMQQLVRKGWISRIFHDRRELILSSYLGDMEFAPESATSPESDNYVDQDPLMSIKDENSSTGFVVHPPRRTLHLGIVRGEFVRDIRQREVELINTSGLGDDQVKVVDSVRCEIPGLNHPQRSVQGFLEPVVSWKEVPTFNEYLSPSLQVAGIRVDSMRGISPQLCESISQEIELSPGVLEVHDRYTLAAFRLDVTEPLDLHDVRLVDAPEISQEPDRSAEGDNSSGPILG